MVSLAATFSRLEFLYLSLWSPLTNLPGSFDSEFDVKLTLSINVILYVIVLRFSFLFFSFFFGDSYRKCFVLLCVLH